MQQSELSHLLFWVISKDWAKGHQQPQAEEERTWRHLKGGIGKGDHSSSVDARALVWQGEASQSWTRWRSLRLFTQLSFQV